MTREIVHVGRKIRVAIDTQTAPDGTVIRRDMIFHPGAVVILPVLDRERIVLLRNHRFVIDETLWEVPAGTREPDEPLEECAKRELLEETGYRAAK
ncbi:MAG TPA: NUDIX hydrolase, partial [Urbifossiella sp.]